MYHQFNIQQFHILPTQCFYVFCVDLRTNSDYFPIYHQLSELFKLDTVQIGSAVFSETWLCVSQTTRRHI